MGKTISIRHESQCLYHLTSKSSIAICVSIDAHLLIHSCLGHPSLSKFQKMVTRFSTLSSLACESCQLRKHTRVSFPKRLNNQAKSPFELVHTDVWGPYRTASTLGFQYFVTFIDDYSRCTWLFLMKNGVELYFIFQKNGVELYLFSRKMELTILMSLVVLALFIFSLQDKISFSPKPQNAYS